MSMFLVRRTNQVRAGAPVLKPQFVFGEGLSMTSMGFHIGINFPSWIRYERKRQHLSILLSSPILEHEYKAWPMQPSH